MKRKIFSILFALVLALGFVLGMAIPVGAIGATTLYEYWNTGDTGSYGSWEHPYNAQTFTTVANHTVDMVKLKLFRTGSPGDVTVSIRATDGSGHPTDTDLTSETINGNDFPTAPGDWYSIVLSTPYDLTYGTKYAIVVLDTGADVSNCINWRVESPGTYTDGNCEYSGDGTNWSAISGADFMFEVWGPLPEEVWVDDDYYDGGANDGHTWGYDAFALIGDGIDAVASPGTVNVLPGTYNETDIEITKTLTVASVSGDWHDTTLNVTGDEGFMLEPFGGGPDQFHEDFTISGLTINGGDFGIDIDGLAAGNTVTISNCHIYEAALVGIFGSDYLDGDIFIDNCVIGENGWDSGSGGIQLATITGTLEITDSFIGGYWDGIGNYWPNSTNGIVLESIEATASVLIDNNIIAENGGYGIYCPGDTVAGELTITDNIIGAYAFDPTEEDALFTGNGDWGILIEYVTGDGVVTIDGNKLAENDYGIRIGANYGESTISNNYVGAWTQGTITYDGNDNAGIIIDQTPAGSLLIQGNNISKNGYNGLTVANNSSGAGEVTIDSNTIDDNGTGGYGNYLTNLEYATISNNTITRHTEVSPYSGIYLASSSYNTISGNTINENDFGIYIDSTSYYNEVLNNTIQDNNIDGIFIAGDDNEIIGNTISNNQGAILCGIQLAPSAEDNVINYNNITANTAGFSVGVQNDNTSTTVDATYNWWGDASGPYQEDTNPDGLGDAVSDYVDYDPWLGQQWSGEVWVDDDYTPATPGWGVISFASIQDAIDAVPAGTIIHVAAGEYGGDIYIDFSLTLQGAGADVTTIYGNVHDYAVCIELGYDDIGNPLAETVVLDGFEITDAYSLIQLDDVVNGSSLTISNNHIHYCEDGIDSYDYDIDGSTVIIENNEINNCDDGIYLYSVASSSTVTIQNNEIYECWDGICFYAVEGGSAVTIQDNNIYDNEWEGLGFGIVGDESTVTIQNNNIHDNGYGIQLDCVSADSTVIIVGNTISNNVAENSGVHLEEDVDTSGVRVNFNNIVGNGPDGIYNGGTGTLNAENNWWGSVNGPGEDGANDVSGDVDYDPWLIVPIIGGRSATVGAGSTLDASSETGVAVDVTSGSATVTAVRYDGNPSTGSFSGGTGQYIDIQLSGVAPGTEIEIRLYYTDAEISGMVDSTLKLLWWDGDSWEECSDSGVDTTDIPVPPPAGAPYSGYIWARITDTSTPSISELFGTPFGGGGSIAGGTWGGGSGGERDTIAPFIFNVNVQNITQTTADVSWSTNEVGTSQVEYGASPSTLTPLDTSLVMSHLVHLTGLTPGTNYHFKVMSVDAASNLAVSVEYTFNTLTPAGEPASFSVSGLSIQPLEIQGGEMVTITVSVANAGGTAGSYSVVLKINGVEETEKSLTLAAGASQDVSFSTTRAEAGSYSVDVNGLAGSFTVAAAEVSAPIAWWIWLIVGVVVVGLVIFLASRRRA